MISNDNISIRLSSFIVGVDILKYIHYSRYMEINKATSAFFALSQKTRLDVFRLLIKAGGEGLLAGELGSKLDVKQNTMSANLTVLLNAGLVQNERRGRTIRYFADFAAVRGLLGFLMEDCCGGRPELCKPIIDEIVCAP